jgi:hypothetical protein
MENNWQCTCKLQYLLGDKRGFEAESLKQQQLSVYQYIPIDTQLFVHFAQIMFQLFSLVRQA